MANTLIKNALIVNEGRIFESDLLIEDQRIAKIAGSISPRDKDMVVDANGKYLIPGIIDDQVHFREPGLTHKATIASESFAAISGGVTSFMEMPNTSPPAVSLAELEKKYEIAAKNSFANYSFYIGTTNSNADEVLRADRRNICGVKIFLGSSTGDMLVNNLASIERIFANAELPIAIHSEDDEIIKRNLIAYKNSHTGDIPFSAHAEIRDVRACYEMTKFATELARKHGSQLHVLHLSTEEELEFFSRGDVENKKITAEVCVHHLYFDKNDYAEYGSKIKCNPAIKEARHKLALRKALLDDRIDVIASDHAPHTLQEKSSNYLQSPSGIPLLAHTFLVMYELHLQEVISIEKIIEKMCHAPAKLFSISERGFIREGYYADLALFDPKTDFEVEKSNIFYKCNWSPFEGHRFKGRITDTFVNGILSYTMGSSTGLKSAQRLLFDR